MMIPYDKESSLDKFSLRDIILVSDLQDGLHAINRSTGTSIWSLNHIDRTYSSLAVQESEFNGTAYSNNNNETLIIEPFGDGNIYFFNIFQGVTKLPISIHQLIMSSPMNLKTNFIVDDIGSIVEDEKTYTGSRQTSMFTIDLETGKIISAFGYGTENKVYIGDTINPFNLIKIGKTTYHLEVHSNDSPSYNITYTTWQQNSLDLHFTDNNRESKDGIYIMPIKGTTDRDNSVMAMDMDKNSIKWASDKFSDAIITNIFDVFTNDETGENVLMQHPFQNKDQNGDKQNVYLGQLDNKSWIALSDRNFPAFVNSAKFSRYSQREQRLGKDYTYESKLKFLRSKKLFKSTITGVHLLNNKKKNHYYNYNINENNNLLLLPFDDHQYYTVPDGDVYIQPSSIQSFSTSNTKEKYGSKESMVDDEDNLLPQFFSPEEFKAYKLRVHQQIAREIIEESNRNNESLIHIVRNFVYRVIESGVLLLISLFVLIFLRRYKVIPPFNALFKSSGLMSEREYNNDSFYDRRISNSFSNFNYFDGFNKSMDNEISENNNYEAMKEDSIHSYHSQSGDILSGVAISSETTMNDDNSVKFGVNDEADGHDNSFTLVSNEKKKKRKNKKNKKKQNQNQIGKEKENSQNNSSFDLVTNPSRYVTTGVSLTTGKSSQGNKLKNLTVFEKILGYGSSGTVVFEGKFQGRPVAVKRMLFDFCDIATREINLLSESDDHPNVIRYYCSESTEKFLYIALELCNSTLEDLVDTRRSFPSLGTSISSMPLTNDWNSLTILHQIAAGVTHLHLLKIIHRDIKPQNILVATAKKLIEGHTHNQQFDDTNNIRILISDFGLCKKLDADKSSFQTNTNNAAGTTGWRAPELLDVSKRSMLQTIQEDLENDKSAHNNSSMESYYDPLTKLRLTRAIDIFSMGCVFFYLLSNGQHPFGDRYMREANIIKGHSSLTGLSNTLKDESLITEAADLIGQMIDSDPLKRPHAGNVLKHPLFWSLSKKLQFLLKVSDRFEKEPRDTPSPLLVELESYAPKVIHNGDWTSNFDSLFIDNLGKYRKYCGASLLDLLRSLRNKYHHFNDMPKELADDIGQLPDGFYTYFTKRFPDLLIEIYKMTKANLKDESSFQEYI